jgi:uncharacterized protein
MARLSRTQAIFLRLRPGESWSLLARRFVSGLLLAAFALSAWAQVAVPELSHRVTDLTATLDAGQVAALENKLAAFETQKGSQIAVLIVPTTQPEDIAQFGIRVADQWKIGRKKIDDGVILIVAKDDRTLRLEVGYGLEGAIPDAVAKRVIAETITPYFKAGDFYGGIDAGVQQVMGLIEGEPLPPPSASGQGSGEGDNALVLLIVGGMIAGWLLSTLMSRPAAGGIAALGSGAVGVLLLGLTPLLLFIAVFVFAGVTSGFRHGGGWSSGGGWGGGSGGAWGGGGGGGFGGGGASGSW